MLGDSALGDSVSRYESWCGKERSSLGKTRGFRGGAALDVAGVEGREEGGESWYGWVF